MLRKLSANRRAFTLIELLVVMVVISVLALIIIPQFADQNTRSKEAALRSDLALLRRAVATFRADTGAWPATLADLKTVPASPAAVAAAWNGPYIQGTVPNDPVSDAAFTYTAASGTVASSATGNDSKGKAFSSY